MLGSIIASVAPMVVGKILGGGSKSSSSAPAPAGGSGGSGDSFAQGFITGINAAPEGPVMQPNFPFDPPGAPGASPRMAEAHGVGELIKLLNVELGGSPGLGGQIQRDISRSPAHLFPEVVSEALRASRDFR